MASCQMFVRGLDGHTLCLRFSSPLLPLHNLKHRLATLLRVPAQFQRIVSGTHDLTSLDFIVAEPDGSFPSCSLLLRLPGGKGGFGSLLRGAATKAGQKKTSNFDACRDMSGRRLRHVNAEKKLKEWKAEAKERELEKTAEVFLKKHAKQKKADSGIAKELDRYRQETSKAMEEVESAVGKGLLAAAKLDMDGKRKKVEAVFEASKKARLWTSFNESEEEDSDGELPGEEHGECSRQPCIKPTASGNQSSSSEIDMDNDDNGTRVLLVEKGGHANVQPCSKPTTSGNLSSSSEIAMDNDDNGTRVLFVEKGGHVNVQPCSKPTTSGNQSSSSEIDMDNNDNDTRVLFVEKSEHEIVSSFGLSCSGDKASGAEGFGSKLASDSEGGCVTKAIDLCCVISKSTMSEQLDQASNKGQQCGAMDIMSSGNVNTPSEEPLNFDKFNKVEELQILGLDRLKFELQSRGLKCGGSLAERAARLFLLKTTPLDKLDKKHFAKTK